MKIRTIGFGYLKTLGNYENCKVYMEAELEDWEDASESLNLLRTEVARELNLHGEWFDLKERVARERRNLEAARTKLQAVENKLEKTQQKRRELTDSLIAHGIDSKLIAELIAERINVGSDPPLRSDFFYQDKYEETLVEWIVKLLQPAPEEDSTSNETPFVGNEYDGCFGGEDDYGDDFDPYYDGENDGGDDDSQHPDCGNENYGAETSSYLIEGDATLEIAAILKNDKEILEKLVPRLETLTWREKIAASQAAVFLISTFSSKEPLLKVVPVRGNTLSTPLREAMAILEGLSPHKLAEVATRILAEDIETETEENSEDPGSNSLLPFQT